MFLQEPEISLEQEKEEFFRSERDICMYDMMRERESRDEEHNY